MPISEKKFAFSLTSEFNHRRVEELYHHLAQDHPDKNILRFLFGESKKNQGEATTFDTTFEYYYAKGRIDGRAYSGKSLQGATKTTKRFLVPGYYDVDLVNAHPTLLLHTFASYGIQAPFLKKYVEERDMIIADIRDEHPVLVRSTIKKAFIAILNCGDYTKITGGIGIGIMDNMTAEIVPALEQLSCVPAYVEIFEAVDSVNKLGKFSSHVFQLAESKVINSWTSELRNVHTNCFDGLLFSSTRDHKKIHEIQAKVARITGIDAPVKCNVVEDIKLRTVKLVHGEFCIIIDESTWTGTAAEKKKIDSMQKTKNIKVGIISRNSANSMQKYDDIFDFTISIADMYRPIGSTEAGLHRCSLTQMFGRFHTQVAVLTDDDTLISKHDESFVFGLNGSSLVDRLSNLRDLKSAHDQAWVDVGASVHHYPSNTVGELPFISYTGRVQVTMLQAGMGGRKTTFMKKLYNSPDSILGSTMFGTCRRSLAMKTISDFEDSLHYCEQDHIPNQHKDNSSRGYVSTFQSLHKIARSNRKLPTTLVIDEPMTFIQSTICCVTNSAGNFEANRAVFKLICENVKYVYLLDANISNIDGGAMIKQFLNIYFPSADVSLHIYDGVAMDRTVREVNIQTFESSVISRLKNGQTVVIPCRTRTSAQYWQNVCIQLQEEEEDPSFDFRVYANDITDPRGKGAVHEWDNMADLIQGGVRAIIYTSKCDVGLSCDLPVDCVCADYRGSGGATGRSASQMLGRFRNLKNNSIIAVFTEKEHTIQPVTHASCLNDLTESKNAVVNSARLYAGCEFKVIEGYVKLTPSEYTSLAAHVMIEHKSHFKSYFYRVILAEGYKTQGFGNVNTEKSGAGMTKFREKITKERAKAINDNVPRIQQMWEDCGQDVKKFDEVIETCKEKMSQMCTSEETSQEIQIAKLDFDTAVAVKSYLKEKKPIPLNDVDIGFAAASREDIMNYAYHANQTDNQRKIAYQKKLLSSHDADRRVGPMLRYPRYMKLRETLAMLNVNIDTPGELEPSKWSEPICKKIVEATKSVYPGFRIRDRFRGTHLEKQQARARTCMKKLLKIIGAKLDSKRCRLGGGKRVMITTVKVEENVKKCAEKCTVFKRRPDLTEAMVDLEFKKTVESAESHKRQNEEFLVNMRAKKRLK